jgi:hypothetical protein
MLSFVGAVGVALTGPLRPGAVRLIAGVAGSCVLAFAVVRSAGDLQKRSSLTRETSAKMWTQVRALGPRPDHLYVIWGGAFPFESVLPFDSTRRLRPLKMFGLGCCTNTPPMEQRLREFGISDLVTALYSRKDLFLMCFEAHLPWLRTYIAEHRGVRVEACPIFEPPGGLFKVYQIRPVAASTSSSEGERPCH